MGGGRGAHGSVVSPQIHRPAIRPPGAPRRWETSSCRSVEVVVLEVALVDVAIGKDVFAAAVHLAVLPFALADVATGIQACAAAVPLAVLEVALVDVASGKHHLAAAVHLAVPPVALVDGAIGKRLPHAAAPELHHADLELGLQELGLRHEALDGALVALARQVLEHLVRRVLLQLRVEHRRQEEGGAALLEVLGAEEDVGPPTGRPDAYWCVLDTAEGRDGGPRGGTGGQRGGEGRGGEGRGGEGRGGRGGEGTSPRGRARGGKRVREGSDGLGRGYEQDKSRGGEGMRGLLGGTG